MRGKGLNFVIYFFLLRITPAYAGKRSSSLYYWSSVKDHPRLCGEKHQKCGVLLWCEGDHPRLCGEKPPFLRRCPDLKGSPPPMRGKGSKWCVGRNQQRITPAYAGKRLSVMRSVADRTDHPRLCGEKFHNFIFHKSFIGSPPPMRGKAQVRKIEKLLDGITPAYAGKSYRLET